jgi:hypothetical protein
MRSLWGVILILASFAASCSWRSAAQSRAEAEPVFPLSKGSYWIYQGNVKWTKAGAGEVVEKTLTWKMEVVEVLSRGQVMAVVLKGFPADLAQYREDTEPGEYLIVRVGPGKFFLLRSRRAQGALKRLRDANDLLHGLVRGEELFLDAPLLPGKIFGEPEQITRQDGSYYWKVEERRQVELKGIKGVVPTERRTQVLLSFQTRPDHEQIEFVPGLGITRYTYVHHGTVSEADVRLIEYHREGE